ncbi:MAG: type II toxin-antitoxin system VapC family toxin [Chloroflexi bacterium]|nr:type II toxin-antitoxin system VapC family toxin [Chloroflexota bacterium]MXX50944.1 type II toxin-antitoxin system VapC family toxin [Chloroflexota bacterium]MYA94693.1 type II toxin-antitoxin system VapC family toxin [Chloroflexota bacterium]MYC56180.1 type II toxin-antitoxin system VapC family toxin [Chloroflexota bacterium]MYD37215.1 type II toxin-antitoxin system VapC family toxin [Chloroflexota bacterium]
MQVFTSVITLTEILSQPLKLGNYNLAREYLDILVTRDEYIVVEISTAPAITAAEIRARFSLRTPDALHAATAIESGCDAFLTNDRGFRRVHDLNVLVLDDLEL